MALYLITKQIGKTLYPKLREWYDSLRSYQKVCSELPALTRALPNPQSLSLFSAQELREKFEQLQHDLGQSNCELYGWDDTRYPTLLKQIPDPPPVIFCRGSLNLNEPAVALVGTRRMTDYGLLTLPRLINPLINAGCIIVSGLAYGIDAAVHRHTLAQKGKTLAVLGSGLADEVMYPKNHFHLAQEILADGGALISEYPPYQTANKHQFVARNRIIAGLSLGTVVIECALKSGALITADYSIDYNRSVYAVPGPINNPMSEGPHRLIGQGAMLIAKGEDILSDLRIELPLKSMAPQLSKEQMIVLNYIQSQPQEPEDLCHQTQFTITTINQILTELELKQLIHRQGNKIVSLV